MKQCKICNAVEGSEAGEVFGRIGPFELGCWACVGVSYFPNFQAINMYILFKRVLVVNMIIIFVLVAMR